MDSFTPGDPEEKYTIMSTLGEGKSSCFFFSIAVLGAWLLILAGILAPRAMACEFLTGLYLSRINLF